MDHEKDSGEPTEMLFTERNLLERRHMLYQGKTKPPGRQASSSKTKRGTAPTTAPKPPKPLTGKPVPTNVLAVETFPPTTTSATSPTSTIRKTTPRRHKPSRRVTTETSTTTYTTTVKVEPIPTTTEEIM
ncbi:hypothetical protein OSTOST_01428 [Ostertagia ostertagi]